MDGWAFYSMKSLAVEEKPGCLLALFGAKSTTTFYNMLVFRKQV